MWAKECYGRINVNLGTVHFGSGGNLSYGNREGPHFDAVILNPTVYLDDTLIMKDGKFKNTYLKYNSFNK